MAGKSKAKGGGPTGGSLKAKDKPKPDGKGGKDGKDGKDDQYGYGKYGKDKKVKVDKKDKTVPQGDRSRMSVSLAPLSPGKYRVLWRALSVDTHVSEGEFTFEVAP